MCESIQKTNDYTSKNQKQKFINKIKKSLLNVISYRPLCTSYELKKSKKTKIKKSYNASLQT